MKLKTKGNTGQTFVVSGGEIFIQNVGRHSTVQVRRYGRVKDRAANRAEVAAESPKRKEISGSTSPRRA